MNIKEGLDYFPFPIDFFLDEKIQFISAKFGMKGEAIVIRLICRIYRKGYYTDWSDDIALLFSKEIGDNCDVSFVNKVVQELVGRGFFNNNIFEVYEVLTSCYIQERFLFATKRRIQVEMREELVLAEVSEHPNVNIIPM